jgi:hypothetical protein
MSDDAVPIQYHLHIHDQSFLNDARLMFEATTPFMSFHVGEFIDPRSVNVDELPEDVWWRITAVMHRLWEIEPSHIGHQVGLTVVAVPKPE